MVRGLDVHASGGTEAIKESGEENAPPEGPPTVETLRRVALIAETVTALSQLQGNTGLGRTDLINRALQLYAYVDNKQRAGAQVIIRDPADETDWVLRLT